MSKFSDRAKAVDLLFDGYFSEGKGAVIALLPANDQCVLQLKSTDEETQGSQPSAAESKIQLLQFMAEGYLEQYQHYDNQRAKLAGILVAAVAGFSIAPFALTESASYSITFQSNESLVHLRQWLVFASGAALVWISILAWISSLKHRLRMKTAYERYRLVLKELEKIVGDVDYYRKIHKWGERIAKKKVKGTGIFRGEQKKSERGKEEEDKEPEEVSLIIDDWTRGSAWAWLPWVVILYAVLYCYLFFNGM